MNSPLTQTIVECLGWTLVHFLWQGVALAALLAAALRLLRRATPNQRYLAGCLALLLMAGAPVVTFKHLLKQNHEPASVANFTFPQTAAPSAEPATDLTPLPASPVRHFAPVRDSSVRLEMILPWIVAAWAVGVLVLSLRLLAGWAQVRRLQRAASAALDEMWHRKLGEVGARLGVSRPVKLLQSALVEVPTVIGWLRPMILLPASCLMGLAPGQLEAILAHELAHIRRHDYLVNLLQSAVETLLFYHPVVWWVSRQVREERENCCDDLAVEVCGDRIAYARALATLEELRHAPAQLALAASGAPLLQRIRRLAGQSGRAANAPAWPMVVVIVLLVIAPLACAVHGNKTGPAKVDAIRLPYGSGVLDVKADGGLTYDEATHVLSATNGVTIKFIHSNHVATLTA
jgi:beta-lactamase regulating signal transducer with metallopeptidase domain